MAVIAVVDHDESVRRSTTRLLRAAGYDVRLFDGGSEFLCSLDWERPACVLLDHQMPVGMDGNEVLTRLTRHRNWVPVIVVTGHDSPEYRQTAAANGVSAFFPKPFDVEALLAAIARVVAKPNKPPPPDPELAALRARAAEIKRRSANLAQELAELSAKIEARLNAQRMRGRDWS